MATISKATVISVKEYGSDIREYSLRTDKNAYFEAGSFLQLTLKEKENYDKWPESRNFSIASAYDENGFLRLVIKRVGPYTSLIFEELSIGKTCTIKYAFGDFILPFYDKQGSICCIAGGTGIAPTLSFCEQLAKRQENKRLHVFYSFKKKEDSVGVTILKSKVFSEQLHLFCTKENYDEVNNRRIELKDIIESKIDILASHFYICGNEKFTTYFKEGLATLGAKNIYTDEWQ